MAINFEELPDDVVASLTAYGESADGVRVAHRDERQRVHDGSLAVHDRLWREQQEQATLAPGATRASGSGTRRRDEEPDEYRTCFERDLDRIKHSAAFRVLAGKAQVIVNPRSDLIRTRLTHSIEVAQFATSVARAVGLNVALTEAIALGHDCGHGPGGHPAEEAFSEFIEGGFDHAVWGADVTLAPLNLCTETLDGIRNHSWKRPAPSTPEGSVVSWADRCIYVAHDAADALRHALMRPEELPALVKAEAGLKQSSQIRYFTNALIEGIDTSGVVGMPERQAVVLDTFRAFNYDRLYMRDESRTQALRVVRMLRALVEHHVRHPGLVPGITRTADPGSDTAVLLAVNHVASLTDRHAIGLAVELLDWPEDELPVPAA